MGNKILHICNDWLGSVVYENQYKELCRLGHEQIIFHPLRYPSKIEAKIQNFCFPNVQVIYSRKLKTYHKILFKSKIKFLIKDLNNIDVKSIDVTIATTLFSDGALAYELWLKQKIPYIINVRHTDVSYFLKYRKDLISLAIKILKNATKIIFISEAIKNNFYNSFFFSNSLQQFQSKSLVLPNGVDQFWLNKINSNLPIIENKFMFIGKFDKNKNIINTILALKKIKIKYPDITFDMIGGKGNLHKQVIKLIKNIDWCYFHGEISNKDELLKVLRKNKFLIMPSIHETFGLVYIEALTQGLPVLYTKNQGIDGLFECYIGESSGTDVNSIYQACIKLIQNQNLFNVEKIDFEKFDWNVNAKIISNIVRYEV
jgi:glycosyltransferase involved in cell wall biosynthesis